jgi:hypothetical protein
MVSLSVTSGMLARIWLNARLASASISALDCCVGADAQDDSRIATKANGTSDVIRYVLMETPGNLAGLYRFGRSRTCSKFDHPGVYQFHH